LVSGDGGGDVFDIKLYMLNSGEVECGCRVPCTTGDGKDVYVYVCGRDVFEFKLGLNNTEVSGIHVLGPSFVGVKTKSGVGDRVSDITVKESTCSISSLGRPIEPILVPNRVPPSSSGSVPRDGTDDPENQVGRMVEVQLDGILSSTLGSDGLDLALSGGDNVLVISFSESIPLIVVQVDVSDKKFSSKIRVLKRLVSSTVDRGRFGRVLDQPPFKIT